MTKRELLAAVEKELGKRHKGGDALTQGEIRDVLETTFSTITQAVKREENVSYNGFGTWKLRKTKARTGRNPRTGDALKIKAGKHLAFQPSAPVKRALASASARPKTKAAAGG